MVNRKKKIIIGVIILFCISVLLYIDRQNHPIVRKEEKVKYTVQWTFKEGEVVDLGKEEILYKQTEKLTPDLELNDRTYYYLPKGQYKLITRDYITGKEQEIKIIIK